MDKLFWSFADDLDVNRLDWLFGGGTFLFGWFILILITVLVTVWLVRHKEKRTWKIPALVLSGILCLTLLEIPLKIIYKNVNSVSRDPELLGMLKNDSDTSEFILDGAYYALPCPLQVFMDNGWNRIRKNGSFTDIHEMPNEHPEIIFYHLSTSYGSLKLVVEYEGESRYEPGEGTVTAAIYTSSKGQTELYASPNTDFFVTKHGMTENTSFHESSKVMGGKLDGHAMKIQKKKAIDPLSDATLGSTVTFRPEAYQDAEERSRNSEDWKRYGYGCALYDLYQSDYSKARDAVQKLMPLTTVRAIVWAGLFCVSGIVILTVVLIRKHREKQR